MDYNTLDKQMRRFEQSLDRTMLDGIFVVARLDGHGFTRLTKKEWDLEKPFDIRFRDEQRQEVNPVTKETTTYTRHALHMETELPLGPEYSQFLYTRLEDMKRRINV